MNKIRYTKVKVKGYDLKAYGVKKPINGLCFFLIIALISFLDYVTIFNSIDSTFSEQSGYMNHIVTGSIVFVLDILTITISEKLFFSMTSKKALPWVTLAVVLATVVCMIIQRSLSADIIFAPSDDSKSAAEAAAEMIKNAQGTAQNTSVEFHAKPHQKLINTMLAFLPIATTLFGTNISLKRAITLKQMNVIRNRKEINLLLSQEKELSEYDSNFDEDIDNDEKRDAMKNVCFALVQEMAAEKANKLAEKLGDAESATYIAAHSSIDLDPPQAVPGNSPSTAITQNSSSVSIPLQQKTF